MKIKIFLNVILFSACFIMVSVLPVIATGETTIASYDMKFIIDGYPFTGTTTISEVNSDSTYISEYGSYDNFSLTKFSDMTLTGNVQGKTYRLYINNWESYYDNNLSFVFYSQQTIRFEGTADTYETEYNKSVIIEENDTYLIEEYDYRERENGKSWVIKKERDIYHFEDIKVNMTVNGNDYEVYKVIMTRYDINPFTLHEIYDGKTINYVTFFGDLIKQEEYDEANNLVGEMNVIELFFPTESTNDDSLLNDSGSSDNDSITSFIPLFEFLFLFSCIVIVKKRKFFKN